MGVVGCPGHCGLPSIKQLVQARSARAHATSVCTIEQFLCDLSVMHGMFLATARTKHEPRSLMLSGEKQWEQQTCLFEQAGSMSWRLLLPLQELPSAQPPPLPSQPLHLYQNTELNQKTEMWCRVAPQCSAAEQAVYGCCMTCSETMSYYMQVVHFTPTMT